jgi:hypothetical protein
MFGEFVAHVKHEVPVALVAHVKLEVPVALVAHVKREFPVAVRYVWLMCKP